MKRNLKITGMVLVLVLVIALASLRIFGFEPRDGRPGTVACRRTCHRARNRLGLHQSVRRNYSCSPIPPTGFHTRSPYGVRSTTATSTCFPPTVAGAISRTREPGTGTYCETPGCGWKIRGPVVRPDAQTYRRRKASGLRFTRPFWTSIPIGAPPARKTCTSFLLKPQAD